MSDAADSLDPKDPMRSNSSKFRFKSKKRSHLSEDKPYDSKRRGRGDFRPKRHKSLNDDATAYDDSYVYNARSGEYVDPDTLFRESLFDALADDEGAAYWEGVYGQPIHVYADTKPGREGSLERMTEEEYAEHVRSKMWEKTHQHVVEERARQARQREERRKGARDEEETRRRYREAFETRAFAADVDEALAKSRSRTKSQRWEAAWQRYTQGWEQFSRLLESNKSNGNFDIKTAKDVIPWPVDTGKSRHVTKDDVTQFFQHAPPRDSLLLVLKAERIRWHPDKMQQRFGSQRLDDTVLKKVTAVFQAIDTIWLELKKNEG